MSAKYCSNKFEEDGGNNVMRVELKPGVKPKLDSIKRNFYMNSSCGVCGKASINHIKTACQPITDVGIELNQSVLMNLPNSLEATQTVFKHTGGLHACGIFDKAGKLILHKEDVGRHNALDKVIGALLLNEMLPASNYILMLSGRISFELVQKAIKAGILVVAAVGAPSSLSISLADEFGITLVGFLKEKGFNIYTGGYRITD
jgi:FdhD protein